MDKLDRRIIAELETDGQATNASIARIVSVSEETVRRRLKRLIADNALSVVAIPNPVKLGFSQQAIIGINVQPSLVDEVSAQLAALPAVQSVSITTGAFDIFVQVLTEDQERMYQAVRTDIAQISGIVDIQTFMVLEAKKVPHIGTWNNGRS